MVIILVLYCLNYRSPDTTPKKLQKEQCDIYVQTSSLWFSDSEEIGRQEPFLQEAFSLRLSEILKGGLASYNYTNTSIA